MWLNKGSWPKREASMSIPGIFKPVSTDNRLLDGGLGLVLVDARGMGASSCGGGRLPPKGHLDCGDGRGW